MTISKEEFERIKDTPITDLTKEDFHAFFDYVQTHMSDIVKKDN